MSIGDNLEKPWKKCKCKERQSDEPKGDEDKTSVCDDQGYDDEPVKGIDGAYRHKYGPEPALLHPFQHGWLREQKCEENRPRHDDPEKLEVNTSKLEIHGKEREEC